MYLHDSEWFADKFKMADEIQNSYTFVLLAVRDMQEPSSIDPEISDMEHPEHSRDIAPGWTATGQSLEQATDANARAMQETCSTHSEQSSMEPGKHNTDSCGTATGGQSLKQATDANATVVLETCSMHSEQSVVVHGEHSRDIAPGHTETGQPLAQASDGSGKHGTTPQDNKEKRRRYLSLLKYFKMGRVSPLAETKDGQFLVWEFFTEKEQIVCHPEDQLPAIDAQTPAKRVQIKNGRRHIAKEYDCKNVCLGQASDSKCVPQKEDEFAPKADDVPSDLDHLRAQEQQANPPEQSLLVIPWSLTHGDLLALLTERLESCRLVTICVGKRQKRQLTGGINSVLRWEQRKRRLREELVYIKIKTSTIEGGQVEYLLTKRETLERLAPGDLIIFRRLRGVYYHYTVYIGEGLVVHLTPSRNALRKLQWAEVKKEKLFDMLSTRTHVHMESGRWKDKEPLPVPEIIKRAQEQIGKKGVHLLKRNCEHFARECRYGQPRSEQVDNLMKSQGIQFHLAPTPMAVFVETSSWVSFPFLYRRIST